MNLVQRSVVFALVLLGALACESDQGPNWVPAGTHLAQITEFEIPDTVRAADTLTIVLSAMLQMDRVEFSHIETEWIADTLQIGDASDQLHCP